MKFSPPTLSHRTRKDGAPRSLALYAEISGKGGPAPGRRIWRKAGIREASRGRRSLGPGWRPKKGREPFGLAQRLSLFPVSQDGSGLIKAQAH